MGKSFLYLWQGLHSAHIALCKRIMTVCRFSLSDTFLWVNVYGNEAQNLKQP